MSDKKEFGQFSEAFEKAQIAFKSATDAMNNLSVAMEALNMDELEYPLKKSCRTCVHNGKQSLFNDVCTGCYSDGFPANYIFNQYIIGEGE